MEIEIRTEYIKLNQLLKLAGVISSGSDTRYFVAEELVKVNQALVTQLRKKIYPGDMVDVAGFGKIKITQKRV